MEDPLYRFELVHSFAVISSPICNAVYENNRAITGALESIKIWNLKTGEAERSLVEETIKHPVTVLMINPINRNTLAAGYEDGSVRLWDITSGKLIVQFSGHRTSVTALSFDPHTLRLASGGRDSDIIIWDLVAECGISRLQGHTGGITCLKFIHSGQFLLSSARDGLVKAWDVEGQHPVETCVEHRGEVLCMTLSSDENVLMTGSVDGFIRVFNIDHQSLPMLSKGSTGVSAIKIVGQIQRNTKDRVLQLELSHSQNLLTILSADRALEFFEIRKKDEAKAKLRRKKKNSEKSDSLNEETVELCVQDLFKPVRVYKLPAKANSFSYSFVSESKSSISILLSLVINQVLQIDVPIKKSNDPVTITSNIYHQGHRNEIKAVSISPDQKYVVSGGSDGCTIWTCEGVFLRSLPNDIEDVTALQYLPDSQHVLIATKKGALIYADTQSGEVLEAYQAHEGQILSMHLGADGRTLITGSSDKTVKFWEVKKGRCKALKTLSLTEEVLCVRQSPDLRLVAVALLDLTVKVFYADSLKIFLTLYGHKLPVTSIDISSDSKTLISASLDKSVKVWGLEFGELRKSILAHSDAITQIAFCKNIPAFISVGKDRQIKMWSCKGAFPSLQRSFTPFPHQGEIWALAMSESGRMICTAGHDRSVKIWRVGNEPLIEVEEAEREAEDRLQESVLQSQQETDEPGKSTVETLKAGERIYNAIEAADAERLARDEARLAGLAYHTPTPLFAVPTYKDWTPGLYLMRELESIPAPDLNQALLTLPTRHIPSLLFYLDEAIDTAYLSAVNTVLNTVMRLFFHEIVADGQMRSVLRSIKEKLRNRIATLDSLYLFNAVALKQK